MKTDKFDHIILKIPGWVFTIAVAATVLYLTLMPDPVPEMDVELFPGVDKVVHAIMMMGVFLCMAVDVMRRDHKKLRRLSTGICVTLFIITAAFGGIIELLQSMMDMGRGCEINDFWADMAGALTGWIIVRLSPWPRLLPFATHRPADHD